jgi:hypothetical protein
MVHVMAGLVPAIHVFSRVKKVTTWMPATSAGMTSSWLRGPARKLVALMKH